MREAISDIDLMSGAMGRSLKPTPVLRAFLGDPQVKSSFVAHMKEQRDLNTGFRPGGKPAACMLDGCSSQEFPTKLGLPGWMAFVESFLINQLPAEEADQFAAEFLEVIPVGAEVARVWHQLSMARLDRFRDWLKPQYQSGPKGNHQPCADGVHRPAVDSAYVLVDKIKELHQDTLDRNCSYPAGPNYYSTWQYCVRLAEAIRNAADHMRLHYLTYCATASLDLDVMKKLTSMEQAATWLGQVEHYRWEAKTLIELLRNA